jgi:transposase
LVFTVPEDALPPTHPARVLWDVVGTLDRSRFLAGVKSVEGTVGRKTLSPRRKLVLWLYAVQQGMGSAREMARRVQTDAAFRWIVGDLKIGHHCLSKFRMEHGAALDARMTDILASLMHQGVLSLDRVAQDGMRVRADATAPSFRRLPSLLECREQAALHLKAVLAQADDPELSKAQGARREAAARDFQRRIEEAIATVEQLQKTRKPTDKPARASTTDPEARVRKMPDGGFRPAYNVPMATAGSEMGGPPTIDRCARHQRWKRYGLDGADARRHRAPHGCVAQHAAGRRQSRLGRRRASRDGARRSVPRCSAGTLEEPWPECERRATTPPSWRGASAWPPTRRSASTKRERACASSPTRTAAPTGSIPSWCVASAR